MAKTSLALLLLFASCAAPRAAQPTPPPAAHEHAGPVGHRFTNAEHWAQIFDNPARDAWQRPDEVVRLLALQPGMTVADIGAGTGYFMSRLSAGVGPSGSVLELDVEPDMVRYLRQRAARAGLTNVIARRVEADDPGLPAGAIQRVLIVDTWHHIADHPAYARKLAAALAPGGLVMVVDFTLASRRGPPRRVKLPPEQVVAELASAGLHAEILAEDLPDQYIVVGKRP